MDWSLFADIATAISSIATLIVVFQFIREIKGQNAEAFFYLHQYLSQDQFSDARKKVRTELYNKPLKNWTENDMNLANKVCSSYDQAGMLISSGILNKKTKTNFLSSSWGRSIMDQYESLSDFLDAKQTPTMTGRDFFKHFVWLYQEAGKYQKQKV